MRHRHLCTSASLAALVLIAAAGLSRPGAADDAPPRPTTRPILHLLDGGFVAGQFAPGVAGDTPGLAWQGETFTSPFVFKPEAIDSILFPMPATAPTPDGDFRFELTGRDILFGRLLELSDKSATVEVAHLGKLTFPRDRLERIEPMRRRHELIFNGPGQLSGWAVSKGEGAGEIREESGQIVIGQGPISVFKAVDLPPRALIEVAVSWKAAPVFALGLGVERADAGGKIAKGYRIESWGDQISAIIESSKDADLAPLQKVDSKTRSIRLRAFLDQTRNRLVVDAMSGARLADIQIPNDPSVTIKGLFFEGSGGEVRLEQIRIFRWEGTEPPAGADLTQAHVRREDGSVLKAKVVGYDTQAREFLLEGEPQVQTKDAAKEKAKDSKVPEKTKAEPAPKAKITRVSVDSVNGIVLEGAGRTPEAAYRVTYQDGTQLSGAFVGADDKAFRLRVPGVPEPVSLPVDGLRMVGHVPPASASPAPTPEPARSNTPTPRVAAKVGTTSTPPASKVAKTPTTLPQLEMDGVRLLGSVEPVPAGVKGAIFMAFKPEASTRAAPIRAGFAGKVTSVEVRGSVAQSSVTSPVAEGFRDRAYSAASRPARFVQPPCIYLVSGDIIPGEIQRIDEEGLTLKSPIAPATFIPHSRVKAVELATEAYDAVRLTAAKRDRLLTLPRMQKGSPPTHLIRSKNGDFVRGRLAEMTDKVLRLEVRLETKEIDRDDVSRIIWLHPEELEAQEKEKENAREKGLDGGKEKAEDAAPKAAPAPAPAPVSPNRVQVVRKDNTRVTFEAEKVEDGSILGKSDILGVCYSKVSDVERVLFGGAIEKEANTLAYQQWKLRNAEEPKIPAEDGTGDPAGGNSAGTASALVNQPAPDFRLDMLDGKPFKLSESRGQVVILDFWATWCGPCLQAMPQVEKVAAEFAPRGVKLVAVNLQEQPRQIKATLERHKLKVDVALDTNGAIAEKYRATAIPQTVIVGKDGKVARLFVGGGPRFGEQLRAALTEVLKDAGPK